METADEVFVASAIEATRSPELTAAAARLHTTTWWLTATATVVVDAARYAEALAAVGND